MARADSYNRHAVKNLINEHSRRAKNYKNDVDLNRSHLNWGYGLHDLETATQYLAIMTRCNEIMQGRDMQGQTNVISEWVITYPARLCHEEKYDTGKINKKTGEKIYKTYNVPNDMEHCKRFFDLAYWYTCGRYGNDNVMCGFVNMDETTPHMHVDVVPEAISRKTGMKTVSSASLLTKAELQGYQRNLQKEMIQEFGLSASDYILNGRTKGNYTVREMKARRKQASKDKALQGEIISKQNKLKDINESIALQEEKNYELIGDIWANDEKLRSQENIIINNEKTLKKQSEMIKANNDMLKAQKAKISKNMQKEKDIDDSLQELHEWIDKLKDMDPQVQQANDVYETIAEMTQRRREQETEQKKIERQQMADSLSGVSSSRGFTGLGR